MSAPGVLAVMDAAARDLAIHCPEADDAGHHEMVQARAKVAELIAAAKAVDESFHPATEARLRAALAACGEQS